MDKNESSHLGWDEYFINIAEQVAKKSKDPSTKTGCVIVDNKNRPISFGYNGFMGGCDETKMSNERPIKYYLVIHAEMNAILFARKDLENCILYTLYAPCENCLKHIIQAGIKKIIYKNSVVESRANNNAKSMTNPLTDEAVTRLLLSKPEIDCHNVNGKSYLEEIWGNEIPKY
ncbi:MAG: dCMP deaminase family protein [Patescibacteria group bacterium]|nr:dCMP deaminase family protein [Patescibacteria group bacterium]MDD4304470.1 dCMP deaminase family protein [Patescibacteria group bacterium]MDD4694830.1 dCMP deaminase family protein [Patescibacteria group bacterium]